MSASGNTPRYHLTHGFRSRGLRQSLLCAAASVLLTHPGDVAAQRPPTNLQLVGDHWTAWQPPADHGAGHDNVYIVRPGDSLWSIAESHTGDPYLWPRIWEQNQYVLDAHWIYPGDPLVLSGLAGLMDGGGDGIAAPPLDQDDSPGGEFESDPFDELADESAASIQSLRSRTSAPVPLGSESDIYCSGFVGSLDEAFPYSISGSEYDFLTPTLDPRRDSEVKGLYGRLATEKYGLGMGDIVYVDSGRADGLSPGELLTAVRSGQRVIHPISGKDFGRLYEYMGRVRVLSAQEDTAIAEIVYLCDPIPVGTSLMPFEPEPVPLRRTTPLRPVNYPASNDDLIDSPVIIQSWRNVVSLGAGLLVFIDQGSVQGVAPGDIFTVYRTGRKDHPPVVLGEVGILRVYEESALARILRSRYSIYVGDLLALK